VGLKLSDMNPFFAKDGIAIYCSDSIEFADDIADSGGLVLADPPYGVSERTDRKTAGRGKLAECNDFPPVIGDDKPFDPSPWLSCERLILWGGNHYSSHLPSSSSWLIWDKREGQGSNDNADCELAWSNLGGPARLYSHTWNGMLRASERGEPRLHPTQKPVALMRWVIEMFTEPGDLVIDPYMGSGATLVAAKELGRRAVGIELSRDYCETARRRLESMIAFADLSYPISKKCSGCGLTYRVVIRETFNLKAASPDGLQPWCRACDTRNKRGSHNGWKNFRRILKERNELAEWSEAKYIAMMGNFDCWTCGADVTEWGGGYWVDRVSSKRGYLASNCRPCCWGCNHLKSNRNPESADQDISRYVEKYGRGRVPWDEINSHIKHTASIVPDLTPHLVQVDSPQMSMF